MNTKILADIDVTLSKKFDIEKLLIKTCQTLSESGDYSLCWIGIVNDNTGLIDPLPNCEIKEEYLITINNALNQSIYETKLPSANIFNIGKYYVNNDIWNDPNLRGWRENAIPANFNSIAIFPLIQNLKTIGAVYLYSDKKGFFKHDELMLLQILSMNLSLALDSNESSRNESRPRIYQQERRRKHEKLIVTREKTKELLRLKSAFLENMSHKLRTPLNSIIGFADLLSKSQTTPEEQQEYSQLIVTQSNYLLQLINNLLQISRSDDRTVFLNKETIDFDKIMDELKEIYHDRLLSMNKKQIDLICIKLPVENQINITTDISKFRQIFTNLLDNAIRFTESGEIRFGYYYHNKSYLKCFVSDTGTGINDNEKERLFSDVFRQADETSKRNYGDPGLGLAICKGNALLLGGDIWVESEHGKGSTFFFTVKHTQYVTRPTGLLTSRPQIQHWKTNEILLIEDDLCTIMYLTKILAQEGIRLLVAHDGKETELFYPKLQEIDLVLLDVSLPDMNGLDLVKKMRTFSKSIPVIAQTALTVEDNGKEFLEAGCDGYITKPYKRDQVMGIINSFISI